ncbi:hypothetical protein ARMA_1557 [Ardenticatena maritima]|uniref:Molybdopterin molybdenumtransferase n=1 Tax=Ardenticatena maritima TaxID=872965 RepID=A0A0N0RFJ8_9CHLR|nr:gephyrin-like molybdotransferase Glp [Ardenticatena maritima]KPL89114.1 hypothetical protein SE16_00840 [Ardenticatena maritima]GAP63134.1 hypothetical protein ARMA_1557 [Ardenticatena maritima]
MNKTPVVEHRTVEEARRDILTAFQRLPAERIALHEALGRVLAEDIRAPHDVPPFRNSAMDGYAVQAADVQHATPDQPVFLRVVATIAAGGTPTRPLRAGEAMRIMTGAPVPEGADAVVRFEETSDTWAPEERPPEQVAILNPVRPGDNVREAGEDVRQGTVVLPAGTRLTPAGLGVLASLGFPEVPCVRQPRVGILATGDELVQPGEPLAPGKIRNSNEYVNAALVRRAGGIPVPLGIARDTVEALTGKVHEALALGVDMLITSAGVSVGDYDFVKHVLAAEGEMHFWQVSIKPGKPLAFGLLRAPDGRSVPLLGLPGNPVAAYVAFEVFARPAIRKMAGLTPILRPTIKARLQEDVRNSGRRHYMRARVWRDAESGELRVSTKGDSLRVQGSGILSALVWANAFAIIPETTAHVPAGTWIEVELLDVPEHALPLIDPTVAQYEA